MWNGGWRSGGRAVRFRCGRWEAIKLQWIYPQWLQDSALLLDCWTSSTAVKNVTVVTPQYRPVGRAPPTDELVDDRRGSAAAGSGATAPRATKFATRDRVVLADVSVELRVDARNRAVPADAPALVDDEPIHSSET